MIMSYTIVRYYFEEDHESEIIQTGLTLEEAQAWCTDPETSSRTARSEEAERRTDEFGPWFDGYREVDQDDEANWSAQC
jgi:hypothetical protein